MGPADAHQQRRDLRQRRRPSSATAARGSRRSAPRRARAPRSSPWPARSTAPASSRCPMGTPAARDHLRHRRRHPRRAQVQGRPDRRPLRRLHPRAVPRPAGRLRVARQGRLDHGLGRPDRHGRDLLHGGRGQVLHGVLPRRVLRQVHPLPRRHGADARPAREDHAGRGDASRTSRCSRSSADLLKDTSLCGLGPDGAQPRRQHAALLPRRVPRPHRREALPGRGLHRSPPHGRPRRPAP